MLVVQRPETDTPAGPPDAPTPVGRAVAATCGLVAAGTALAAGELAAAARDAAQSPVTAVGTEFIDRFAARLKDLAVRLFGTNDKVALITGIVIVSLLLGAALGVTARRRWLAAPVGIAAVGAVGAWAMQTDPQGTTADAVVANLAAVGAGIAAFAVLWRLAVAAPPATPSERRNDPAAPTPTTMGAIRRTIVDRRAFLAGTAGLAAVAGSATVWSRRIRATETVDAIRRSTVLPRPRRSTRPPADQPFDVPGLSPYLTPNDDFFRIDTALLTPQVDTAGWSLGVTGMVDTPLSISYDELLAMDSVEETVTLQCVSNEVGGRLIGNAVWQGVPLAALLEQAGVHDDATQIVGRSVDGFTAGFPTALAVDGRTALVAYAMNGEPLPADHGFPARLVVSGLYGYVSATKWLSEIELTTWEDVDGYWVPRGWSKEGPVKTMSRIDVPASGAELAPGRQAIAGVAWAPNIGIERVEVQVDDGEWREAELGRTASDDTWVQWHVAWDAEPGEHRLRVRATDATGTTQTERQASPAPNGATGWHTRDVHVT